MANPDIADAGGNTRPIRRPEPDDLHVAGTAPREPYPPSTTTPIRAIVWLLHLSLPLLGLWLLISRPELDARWLHPPSHFWLINAVALLNVVLGYAVGEAARRRRDARLFLVSLTFLVSSGFFLLHGLATPGILISTPNLGFDLAQPVGLAVAAVLAVASSLRLGRVDFAKLVWIRRTCGLLLVGWGIAALPGISPLGTAGDAPLTWLGLLTVPLYAVAAFRLLLVHRRRPAAMLISLITAYALLAETMIAGVLARNWHLSWWEWHLLLLFAFGFVGYSAFIQFRREGSGAGIFDAVTLSATHRRIRQEYAAALEEVVDHLRRRPEPGPPVAPRLAGRFGLTEGQAAVLDRAGEALAAERELSERLSALVEVGWRARVGLSPEEFLAEAVTRTRQAYGDVRVSLVHQGRVKTTNGTYGLSELSGVQVRGGVELHPLTVKGEPAGVLEVPVGGTRQDQALAVLLAGQLSIALENARLYQELTTLFRRYMSPDVAAALLADPEQAALGGGLVEVTALFADLRGFTTFSERVSPAEIVEMLNRYHTAAVPCILGNGGTIVQFVGDALLALFNAPARQHGHALRAARAGLAMQRATAEIAAERPDYPRFRIGVNTGPALVGNIGSPELRGFNAMGDAVNVAARLQALAEPGTVVIGASTYAGLGAASVTPLGRLTLKGKEHPVHAYVLEALP
ncbi:adenylate/guanylate cyclase domain-containing protein [Rhizohabitans arisaemae]|uniref:adenylate/guanylate cyclase domain-containing protein n=1 Tax=Rhizohabitans arisaemae TaxID=2720610 RepID=UPI0024B15C65|nr:adenylate/guanylate cyclase domain-containing protein [Rhizohabitans arisaemae]